MSGVSGWELPIALDDMYDWEKSTALRGVLATHESPKSYSYCMQDGVAYNWPHYIGVGFNCDF